MPLQEKKEWRFETDTVVHSSPAVADGTLYVGCDETLYAIATETANETPTLNSEHIQETEETTLEEPSGKRTCVSCNEDIPEAAIFCPTCGTQQDGQHFATDIPGVDSDLAYCPFCGDKK